MHSAFSYLQDLLPKETARLRSNLIPLYSFISQLLSSFKDFYQSDASGMWIEFIARCKRPAALTHFIQSWIGHSSGSLQCQLLGSLSLCSDKRKFNLYQRLRKYIVQLMSREHLDEITLKHEDTLTIIHRMFPSAVRKEIARGVKQLFLGFKVPEARIYSCVFIEFILSVYDSTGCEEQSLMAGDTKISSKIEISNFSSIMNFSSNLHKQNGPFKGCHPEASNYQIIQTKFLPHELERRKTHFGNETQQSYYYSNSLNFTEQNSQQEVPQQFGPSIEEEKENFMLNRKQGEKGPSFEFKKQILIEESDQNSYFDQEEKDSKTSIELRALAMRNRQFKDRMLEGNSSFSSLGYDEESIRETINIIHSSIVRNHHSKRY